MTFVTYDPDIYDHFIFGSTNDLVRREKEYRRDLPKNKWKAKKVQRIYNGLVKAGRLKEIRFDILHYCDPKDQYKFEQMLIDQWRGNCKWNMNVADARGFAAGENNPNFGKKHSEETKHKMSEAAKRNGNKPPGTKGMKYSEEHKRKLSEAKHKLTMDQADEIRELYATGNYLQKDLAKMFGVTVTPISMIVNNKTYRK